MRKQAQVSERNCLEPVIHEEPGLDLRAHPACFAPVLLLLATFLVGVAGERTAFAYGRNPHPWLVLRKLPFVSKSEPECVWGTHPCYGRATSLPPAFLNLRLCLWPAVGFIKG